ncbi:MAG: hypothetical protein DCC65_02830 [Planctomycetota bacterium]|nr:MAG: hypothetical protein DCC65_02830 [Planctomycetota bacterium]
MASKTINDLQSLVQKLQTERQEHLDAIARIDDAFNDLGLSPMDRPRRGRKPGRKPGKKAGRVGRPTSSKRKRYGMSGTKSIMAFVGRHGAKGASGAEIANHWKSEGRRGSSYNILGSLIKAGRLKKKTVKGVRGSVYLAA